MKKLLVCGLAAVCLFAQSQPGATDVNINEGAGRNGYQTVYAYSGGNVTYECQAISVNSSRLNIRVAISAASNANPVVFTSTGHGFHVNSNARPKVLISGGTGNWTAVNGEWTATVIDANTFSIPVNSTSFGALAGSVMFATTAPRMTVAEWAVKLYAYDGSNNVINIANLNGVTRGSKCSDAVVAGTNVQ